MQILISFFLFFVAGISCASQEKFQLAPPLMKFQSVFFTKQAEVKLAFAQPGTSIHYTINGNDPEGYDLVYTKPILIQKNFTTVKARVFGDDFLPSETIQSVFIKDGLTLKNVSFPIPDEKYVGEGANTLMDNKGGIASLNSKTWLGFKNDSVVINISLSKRKKIKSVLFDMLQDQGSWIFFPEKSEVYVHNIKTGSFEKSGEIISLPEQGKDIGICKPFVFKFKRKTKADAIQLKLYVLQKIPGWHPGGGQKSWIFIDEVKLY